MSLICQVKIMYYREHNEYIEKRSKDNFTKKELNEFIHDLFHNLDLSDSKNLELFDQYKLKYIALLEGEETKAYDDKAGPRDPYKYAKEIFAAGRKPRGSITVGAGFNMDRPEARDEWSNILGKEISFDDVYRGKAKISDDQLKRLLKYAVVPREKELVNSYKEVWIGLRPNEKIAVLSAYYNGPGLVNTNTRFFANLKKYIKTSDSKYLKEAALELSERSRKDPQLIPRRKLEAKLLDSSESPFYVRPGGGFIPSGPLTIIIGKTRVPVGLEKQWPPVQNSDFIIWRSKLDGRVRKSHLEKEGRVYHRKAVHQKEYNCRCEYVSIPNNLLIVDKDNKVISINSWVRYGGASTFEIN